MPTDYTKDTNAWLDLLGYEVPDYMKQWWKYFEDCARQGVKPTIIGHFRRKTYVEERKDAD